MQVIREWAIVARGSQLCNRASSHHESQELETGGRQGLGAGVYGKPGSLASAAHFRP